MKNIIKQKMVEDSLKDECLSSLVARAKRYLQVEPHVITAATHFAGASAECSLLFRDGHYYGCVALTQAVAEALVRFMCERNSFRPSKDFEKNVDKLKKRGFITADMEISLLRIWERRDDYHHLNHQINTDRQTLEKLALEKVQLLIGIENKIFEFTITNGAIKPKYIKYWDVEKGHTQAFLKLHP